MVHEKRPYDSKTSSSIEQTFFDQMVGELRYDEEMLKLGTLDKDRTNFYQSIFTGKLNDLAVDMKEKTALHFISQMFPFYFKQFVDIKSQPIKMAFEMSENKVLVWAEIKTDDEIMENALILAEARTNAEFANYGFSISSTIIEDCDGLTVPSHYKQIEIAHTA